MIRLRQNEPWLIEEERFFNEPGSIYQFIDYNFFQLELEMNDLKMKLDIGKKGIDFNIDNRAEDL